jgi:putative salt-induced outer membrane protein YdiY
MRKTSGMFALVVLLACIAMSESLADTLTMTNGDRLTGRITRIEKDKITFNTMYAGDISVDVSKVQKLESNQLMTLEIEKTRYLYGTLSAEAGRLQLHPEDGGPPMEVSVKENSTIQPGHVTGREWKYSGHINLGGSDSQGNTVVNRTHVDAESIVQQEKFRIITGLTVNHAIDHDQETESNSLLNAKFDRFITVKQYGYGNITLENDRFKDLKLRNTIGAGRGYDALASPRTNLSLEAGLSYVHTNYYSTPDDTYPALRMALRFDYWAIPNRLQLFQQSEVFVGLAGLKKSFAHTKTGLRMPLQGNLVANLEYDVDWDGNPAAGRVTTDRSLIFSLGYHW